MLCIFFMHFFTKCLTKIINYILTFEKSKQIVFLFVQNIYPSDEDPIPRKEQSARLIVMKHQGLNFPIIF